MKNKEYSKRAQSRFRRVRKEYFSLYGQTIAAAIWHLQNLYLDLYIEYFFSENFSRRDFLLNLLVALSDNMGRCDYREGPDFVWEQIQKNDPRFTLRWRIGEFIHSQIDPDFIDGVEMYATNEERDYVIAGLMRWTTEQIALLGTKKLQAEMEKYFDPNDPHPFDWFRGRGFVNWDGDDFEATLPVGSYLQEAQDEYDIRYPQRFEC